MKHKPLPDPPLITLATYLICASASFHAEWAKLNLFQVFEHILLSV